MDNFWNGFFKEAAFTNNFALRPAGLKNTVVKARQAAGVRNPPNLKLAAAMPFKPSKILYPKSPKTAPNAGYFNSLKKDTVSGTGGKPSTTPTAQAEQPRQYADLRFAPRSYLQS